MRNYQNNAIPLNSPTVVPELIWAGSSIKLRCQSVCMKTPKRTSLLQASDKLFIIVKMETKKDHVRDENF